MSDRDLTSLKRAAEAEGYGRAAGLYMRALERVVQGHSSQPQADTLDSLMGTVASHEDAINAGLLALYNKSEQLVAFFDKYGLERKIIHKGQLPIHSNARNRLLFRGSFNTPHPGFGVHCDDGTLRPVQEENGKLYIEQDGSRRDLALLFPTLDPIAVENAIADYIKSSSAYKAAAGTTNKPSDE